MTAVAVGFPALVLFDLDGTLLDSAPDFVATIDRMRAARGAPPITLAELRPHVSRGSRAMLATAFAQLDAERREAMVPEFLELYQQELARHGPVFEGVENLLAAIEDSGSRWGIVTNKPEYLARQLLPLVGWQARCAVLVGGDTLPVRKPDPLPLLHAARQLGLDAPDCAYVGDDARDIEAARAAGMPSITALWGYRLGDDDPATWQADASVDTPQALLDPHLWSRLR
ncbi:phosphoglycolate phosphatase [Cognatiluteimonas telluris]|jgi:phosphoglycolate phosphatase|uniref:phosphoglycolate phosphatase n=1 Tax=Cognatiluteimonas telluris TaxID=1104775 RepID=UPI001409F638|nr:phosphoglycolate phosphatase [Lysobacter telluris]